MYKHNVCCHQVNNVDVSYFISEFPAKWKQVTSQESTSLESPSQQYFVDSVHEAGLDYRLNVGIAATVDVNNVYYKNYQDICGYVIHSVM